MDEVDRKVLEILQKDFPISEDPYDLIARELKIEKGELLRRIMDLHKKGIIKKIIPVMTEKYYSGLYRALIGIAVDESNIEIVSSILKNRSEITHIYLRDNFYNVWFTFAGNSEKSLRDFEENVLKHLYVKKYIILLSETSYKLDVNFRVNWDGNR